MTLEQILNLKYLNKGSEAKVYTDNVFAYRVTSFDPDAYSLALKLTNFRFKNVVNLFEVLRFEDVMVIKMELLTPIEFKNKTVRDTINYLLCTCEDQVNQIERIKVETDDEQILTILTAITNAAKELNKEILDLGFHNVMFDPKTKEYKQIDIL